MRRYSGLPPGATRFAADKHGDGKSLTPPNRQAKIKSRLIADLDPDDGTCRLNQNGCVGAHDRYVSVMMFMRRHLIMGFAS